MSIVTCTCVYNGSYAMTQRKQRNSSIELLRIIAMVMIVAHHYVDHSTTFVSALPPFSGEEYFYLCMRSLGKLGVMLFFSISAWYLCMERHPTARKGLKRAWLLERGIVLQAWSSCAYATYYYLT